MGSFFERESCDNLFANVHTITAACDQITSYHDRIDVKLLSNTSRRYTNITRYSYK
jgi:hypothetical protein